MATLKNGSDFSVKIYGKLVKAYPQLSIDGSSPKKKKFKPGQKSNKASKNKSPKRGARL